jgi:H+-translocating NAD(P) transhydrogenase subunit beta
MSASLTSLAYLVAAVLFILALRGLSSPVTSRDGNRFGMIGMAIAVIATLLQHGMGGWGYLLILFGILIGGGIGVAVALRIQMTALPQLVAAFHSLVGLAAVFVAASALNAPQAFNIGVPGAIHTESLVEMSLGLAIGAITFSGSLIAFAKLQALMKGAPITFAGQHLLNLGLAILLLLLVIAFVASGGHQVLFWLIAILALGLGFLIIIPIGGADMPVVVSMLNWLYHPEPGPDHHRIAGWRVRRDPVLRHVQRHEPQHHQRAAGWLRHRKRRRPGGRAHR